MDILLIARDVSPSRAFEKVAKAAPIKSHSATALLGHGKDVTISDDALTKLVLQSDHVVAGMSSSVEFSAVERRACEIAHTQGVPYSLFSDTFECYRRTHFKYVREHASCLFVCSEAEVENASVLYKNVQVVASGNPQWEDLVVFPFNRADARAELDVTDELLVLCPGNKANPVPEGNSNVRFVCSVAMALWDHPSLRIVFAAHPGDRSPREYYLDHLPDGVEVLRRSNPLAMPLRVHACDLVVSACSPSTDLQALLFGTPVVNVINGAVRQRLRVEFDAEVPPLVSCGYVRLGDMSDSVALKNTIQNALNESGTSGTFPLPQVREGESANLILQTLADS